MLQWEIISAIGGIALIIGIILYLILGRKKMESKQVEEKAEPTPIVPPSPKTEVVQIQSNDTPQALETSISPIVQATAIIPEPSKIEAIIEVKGVATEEVTKTPKPEPPEVKKEDKVPRKRGRPKGSGKKKSIPSDKGSTE